MCPCPNFQSGHAHRSFRRTASSCGVVFRGRSTSGRAYTLCRPAWCACFHVTVIRPTPGIVLCALCSPACRPSRVVWRVHTRAPRLPVSDSGAAMRQVFVLAILGPYTAITQARGILPNLLFTPRSMMEPRGEESASRAGQGRWNLGEPFRENRAVPTTPPKGAELIVRRNIGETRPFGGEKW